MEPKSDTSGEARNVSHDSGGLLKRSAATGAEREALADEPRPGVWIQDTPRAGKGDGRKLTQDETNQLIALEVRAAMAGKLNVADYEDLEGALARAVPGPPAPITMELSNTTDVKQRIACQQRGGISSHPFIRLLAYRMFGDRDRKWTGLYSLVLQSPSPRSYWKQEAVVRMDGTRAIDVDSGRLVAERLPDGAWHDNGEYRVGKLTPIQ